MFNKIKIEFAAIIPLFTFFAIHCSETAPEKYYPVQASYSFTGTSYPYDFVDTTQNVYLDYTLSLDAGVGAKNIYFIFTNVSMSSSAPGPQVAAANQLAAAPGNIGPLESIEPVAAYNDQPSPVALKDLPEATEFNRKITPPETGSDDTGSDPGLKKSVFTLSGPRFSLEGDSFTFRILQDTSKDTPATCKKVVSDGSTTLNIWVANDCWEGYGLKSYEVNQTMVDAMADKFLQAGADNDIYDWVTTIYGDEWGTPPAPMGGYLIPNNNEITILLFDTDIAHNVPPGAWLAGYFWAKDNYQYVPSATDESGFSNERIMFYLNAVKFANKYNPVVENGIWDLDDYYPQQIISTLAHEFQHLIHFYQKAVKTGSMVNSDAWIDEMCSMVTEDLIASKIGVDGPRGYDYNQPGPGLSNNRNGRLPRYNAFNDTSVAYWASTLADYSTKYAFGAYLARNFGNSSTGGANFFNSIVQSPNSNYLSVMDALDNAGNSSDDFGMILRRWGIANILSDDTGAAAPYKYNNGAFWKQSSRGGITYNLGSINLYNYNDVVYAQNGPRIYTSSNLPSSSLAGTANRYYFAGTATGPWTDTWTITMDKNTRLTVLIK